MKTLIKSSVLIALLLSMPASVFAQCEGLLDFESKRLHSKQNVDFCEAFAGKTLLVVNTASRCGFTPQFKELEALYQKYKDEGLEIVGFPSNSFRQEMADEKSTAEVCYKNYGVSFTMVAPSDVKGPAQNAFFKALSERTNSAPNWNFNKYLVSADAKEITQYGSNVNPLNSPLEAAIQSMLN